MQTDRSSVGITGRPGAISVQADRGSIEIGQLSLGGRSEFHTDRTEVNLGLAANRGLNLDLDLDRVSPEWMRIF